MSARFIEPARREFLAEVAHHSRFPEYWQPRVQERSVSDLMDAARCYAGTLPDSAAGEGAGRSA